MEKSQYVKLLELLERFSETENLVTDESMSAVVATKELVKDALVDLQQLLDESIREDVEDYD